MTINSMTPDEALAKADKEGGFELSRGGVYLNTRDDMLAEQKGWEDEDRCKSFDFSTAPYWMTDDSGMEPKAIHHAKDCNLSEALECVEQPKIERPRGRRL